MKWVVLKLDAETASDLELLARNDPEARSAIATEALHLYLDSRRNEIDRMKRHLFITSGPTLDPNPPVRNISDQNVDEPK